MPNGALIGKHATTRTYSFGLKITEIKPINPVIVENEPIDVSYEFTIDAVGLVGELPPLRRLKVCPGRHIEGTTTCKYIDNPQVKGKYRGTVRALAPAASTASPVEILLSMNDSTQEDYGQWHEVGQASKNESVAARYEIVLDSFTTLHTRSRTTDTAYVGLRGLVKSDPPHPSDREDSCNVSGFTWCRENVKYGDVQDGVHPLQHFFVGPYLLTPQVEHELRFFYTVYNLGASYDQKLGLAIAEGFSKAGWA